MKRPLTVIGLVISTAAVGWIALQFDVSQAWAVMRNARLEMIAAAAVLYASLFGLRGLRWARLLEPVAPVSVRTATEVFLVGFMANNVLPARLGDVARGFLLGRRAKIPAAASLSSVVLERIFDGLTVVLFLSVALETAPPAADWVRGFQVTMALVFVGALALCVAAIMVPTERLLGWTPARIESMVSGLLRRVADGLRSLSSVRGTLEITLLSVTIWAGEAAVYVLVADAFGFSVPVFGLVLVMGVLTLGLTAPSAPAFVGVFEGLIISSIGLYGVSGSKALAFAVTLHAVHFLPGSLMGLWAAAKSGFALSSMHRGESTRHSGPSASRERPKRRPSSIEGPPNTQAHAR